MTPGLHAKWIFGSGGIDRDFASPAALGSAKGLNFFMKRWLLATDWPIASILGAFAFLERCWPALRSSTVLRNRLLVQTRS